ncbi:MAG: hypothetical protein AAGF32_09025, partial [Pseudomonadota bacterium]
MAPKAPTRRHVLAATAAGAAFASMPAVALAQESVFLPLEARLAGLVSRNPQAFLAGFRSFAENPDIAFAPHMIIAMRFANAPFTLFDGLLEQMTGESHSGWF